MKFPTRILTGAALMVAALSPSFAQTATTAPVGYRTETLKAGVFNLIGTNLDNAVGAAGTIDAKAGTTLTDNEGAFTTAFTAGAQLILKITSGTNAGIVQDVTAFTATTVTTAQDISALVTAGDKYELRVVQTVASLFGAANEAGLLAGTASSADVIWVPNGDGNYTRIFRSSGGIPGVGWRAIGGGSTDRANFPIAFVDAFFVERKGATDLNVVFVGHVQTTATKTSVINGFNPVSRVIPVGVKLGQSGLETQLQQGTASSADLIWNPDGTGSYTRYFYSTGGIPGVGWRSVGGGSTDRQNDELKSGYLVERKQASATNITLVIPSGLDI